MNQHKLNNSEVTELAYKIVRKLQGKHGFPLIKYNGESQIVLSDEYVVDVIVNYFNHYLQIPNQENNESATA